MSYDLTFWRYRSKPRMAAMKIYEALMEGQNVEGLDELPTEEIREKIMELFGDWKADAGTVLDFEKDEESFQVTLEPNYIRFDCYGSTISYRERLIGLLSNQYNCHMFDPQRGVLFEVVDGQTVRDRAVLAQEELRRRFEAHGYEHIAEYNEYYMDAEFAREYPALAAKWSSAQENYYRRDKGDHTQSCTFGIYPRDSADVMCFTLMFYVRYPELEELVEKIRGVPLEENIYRERKGVKATLGFSIKDASNGGIKYTMYLLKTRSDVKEFVDGIMKDVEAFVFPLMDHTDTLEKYEDMMLHSDFKCVRQPVMYRGYYQIALTLLNRGSMEDKLLNRLLNQEAKNDSEYSESCIDRVKEYMNKKAKKNE